MHINQPVELYRTASFWLSIFESIIYKSWMAGGYAVVRQNRDVFSPYLITPQWFATRRGRTPVTKFKSFSCLILELVKKGNSRGLVRVTSMP